MSGNLDDLEFNLGIQLEDSLKGLREVVSSLNQVQQNIGSLVPAYNELNAATMRLATAGSLPVKNAELLMAGMGSIGNTIERLDGQIQRMDTRLETAVMASTDLAEHWQYVNRDVRSSTDTMRQFVAQTQAAAAAMQTVTINTATNKMTPSVPKPAQGFELIKLASAALAVKAVNTVSSAMTTARTAIASIDTTTKTAVLSLDRFRMGLAAPAVNPALNTLPALIQKISGGVAGAVESFRGFGDATIAGAPAIMTAIAGGMQRVLGSGDALQATVSKITAQFDLQRGALDRVAAIYPTTGTAVGMLKDAMNFIAPAAEKMAQAVDKGNDRIREAAISARNLAFVATGSFVKTGTSADTYAKGAYHALLPTRLMAFEAKFAAGSMGLVRRAFGAVTSPIHAMQMAMQRSSGEFRELRANLPPLTGGLQLSVRAMRAFSYTTLAASQAIASLKTLATPITFIGRSLWNMVRPAKEAKVGLDGVATGGHKAGIVLRGISAATSTAASGLSRVATAGGQAASSLGGGWMSSIASGAKLAAVGIAGLGIAAVGMGSSVAMATEKNQAVFGVMLKDMEQGKAVVASLQGSAAVGLFDNEEVLNSGRLLFKAGVAAVDLSAKTDQLATIAAATSTELGDLTRIYQQGANRGSFGQDKINQLAERGIDIYHALQAVTGKSGAALADMISGGKIGITEMDAALAHLTEGNGIYAGSLQTLGGTTSGMLATIKTNLMQTLGAIMGAGTEARKPFLQMFVGWSESLKTNVGVVLPIVQEVISTIKGLFVSVWTAASAVWTGIFGAASSTFSGILSITMEWVTKFRWFFENLIPIAQFVGLSIAGIFVTAFNDIAFFLTDKIPAYLTWFGENWKNVFTDIFNGTVAIFTNLGKNIANAMTQIWNFIKSGGTADLEFAWTPLLDGFESTVAKLPDIPERAMTELEKSIQRKTQAIGTQLADSFDSMNMEAQAALTFEPPVMPEIDPNLQSGGTGTGGEDTGTEKNKRTNFAVTGLERGSEAALNAIFNAQKDKTPEKALAESKKQTGLLAKLANKPDPMVLGGVP
jgi:tape measure domain-containing protein